MDTAILWRALLVAGMNFVVLSRCDVLAAEPKEKVDDSWIYRSQEHKFSLRLPGKSWTEIGKGTGVAAFHSLSLFDMTAGVGSVSKQSLDEYRRSMSGVKNYFRKSEGVLLEKPEVIEEMTGSGNHRFCIISREKGTKEINYLLVGMSYTWLKERGITVMVQFEGKGKYESKLGKAREKAAFDEAARKICLSVE